MDRYWNTILSEWRNKGRDGFTLPFIIGAQKYLKRDTQHQHIADLLTDIVQSKDLKVYLKYCITTEEIILGMYDENGNNLKGTFPNHKGYSQNQLFLTFFLDNLGKDVEEIIQSLTDRYQGRINKGEFSKHKDRSWGDFEGEEITFIQSSFKTNGLID